MRPGSSWEVRPCPACRISFLPEPRLSNLVLAWLILLGGEAQLHTPPFISQASLSHSTISCIGGELCGAGEHTEQPHSTRSSPDQNSR